MRLCKALRQSSASFGQGATIVRACSNRRYFADDRTRHDDPAQPPAQTASETNPSSVQLASDRDDAFKVDPQNKTVETAVGDLPLSPVMDPTFWEATRRHQAPKVKPGKPQNSVERQLRANPFAKALATPVRMCAMTRARLPSFFLQDFNVVAHPETGKAWLIPHSLLPDEDPADEEPDARGIAEAMDEAVSQENEDSVDVEPEPCNPQEQKPDAKGIAEAMNEAVSQENEDSVDVEPEPCNPQEQKPAAVASTNHDRPHGPAAWILARQDLISSFTVKDSGLKYGPQRLTGIFPRYRHLAKTVIWRQDMDTYILDLMRRDIINDLLYLSKLCTENGRYYVVKCWGWNDVQYKHKGAVLWFGEPDEDADSNQTRNQPGPFATFEYQKTDIQGQPLTETVVVHNISMLLGSEQAKYIKDEAAALKDGSIFMLAGRRTTNLQLKLWKLQGYLADYRDAS
ncbi:hypothetical protein F5Y05DRAFT_36718 [Hypoxylon sp. FL0543]|nr:hypothetical protein F5Y05DRAFT_36718 [Hypoxylon sp. FL0543]